MMATEDNGLPESDKPNCGVTRDWNGARFQKSSTAEILQRFPME
jgi:hypothetical protein